MFSVSEAEAAAIPAAYERGGELAAAVEVRRRFPGIFDNAQARECARIIASWKPLPKAQLLSVRVERKTRKPPRGHLRVFGSGQRHFNSDSAQRIAFLRSLPRVTV